MNNIFENAYFGKPYKTRDDRKLLYIHSSKEKITKTVFHKLLLENDGFLERIYDDNGTCLSTNRHSSRFDIVSEWQEEINDEEIRQNAIKDFRTFYDKELLPVFIDGYDAGYRKAKSE